MILSYVNMQDFLYNSCNCKISHCQHVELSAANSVSSADDELIGRQKYCDNKRGHLAKQRDALFLSLSLNNISNLVRLFGYF